MHAEARPNRNQGSDCETARAGNTRPQHSESPRGARQQPPGSHAAAVTASQDLDRPTSSMVSIPVPIKNPKLLIICHGF